MREIKCEHNDFGYDVIEHDGISHPTGKQHCFNCGKTIDELLQQQKEEIIFEIRKNMWDDSGKGDYLIDATKLLSLIKQI